MSNFVPLSLSQARALTKARRFAERYPAADLGLFFSGEAGLGKTHLSVAIVKDLLERYLQEILFVDFEALARGIAGDGGRVGDDGTSWQRLQKSSLLVLDNFGIAAPSPAVIRCTQQLLTQRLIRRRPTICTGTPVRWRELFQLPSTPTTSPTQAFLSAFSPSFLLEFIHNVKVVTVQGPDERKRWATR